MVEGTVEFNRKMKEVIMSGMEEHFRLILMGTKTQRQISTGTLGIWHIPCSFSVGGRHLKLEQAMNVNFLFVLFFFQQPFIMCCLYTRTRARYWNLKDVLGLFRGFFEVKVIKLII